LKNSVVPHDQEADPDRRIVQILCDEEEARQILAAGFQVYPEVTRAIRAAISLPIVSSYMPSTVIG